MKYVKDNQRLLIDIFKDVDMAVDNDVDNLHDSLSEAGSHRIARNMSNNNLININNIQNST